MCDNAQCAKALTLFPDNGEFVGTSSASREPMMRLSRQAQDLAAFAAVAGDIVLVATGVDHEVVLVGT
jgi:hypothetical protein